MTAFPDALGGAEWTGNPVRAEIADLPDPRARYAGRSGPLRLLVVGGSLGAQALNEAVPRALALLPDAERPRVVHQSGEKNHEARARITPRRASRAPSPSRSSTTWRRATPRPTW